MAAELKEAALAWLRLPIIHKVNTKPDTHYESEELDELLEEGSNILLQAEASGNLQMPEIMTVFRTYDEIVVTQNQIKAVRCVQRVWRGHASRAATKQMRDLFFALKVWNEQKVIRRLHKKRRGNNFDAHVLLETIQDGLAILREAESINALQHSKILSLFINLRRGLMEYEYITRDRRGQRDLQEAAQFEVAAAEVLQRSWRSRLAIKHMRIEQPFLFKKMNDWINQPDIHAIDQCSLAEVSSLLVSGLAVVSEVEDFSLLFHPKVSVILNLLDRVFAKYESLSGSKADRMVKDYAYLLDSRAYLFQLRLFNRMDRWVEHSKLAYPVVFDHSSIHDAMAMLAEAEDNGCIASMSCMNLLIVLQQQLNLMEKEAAVAVVVQKHVRRIIAKRYVNGLRKATQLAVDWLESSEELTVFNRQKRIDEGIVILDLAERNDAMDNPRVKALFRHVLQGAKLQEHNRNCVAVIEKHWVRVLALRFHEREHPTSGILGATKQWLRYHMSMDGGFSVAHMSEEMMESVLMQALNILIKCRVRKLLNHSDVKSLYRCVCSVLDDSDTLAEASPELSKLWRLVWLDFVWQQRSDITRQALAWQDKLGNVGLDKIPSVIQEGVALVKAWKDMDLGSLPRHDRMKVLQGQVDGVMNYYVQIEVAAEIIHAYWSRKVLRKATRNISRSCKSWCAKYAGKIQVSDFQTLMAAKQDVLPIIDALSKYKIIEMFAFVPELTRLIISLSALEDRLMAIGNAAVVINRNARRYNTRNAFRRRHSNTVAEAKRWAQSNMDSHNCFVFTDIIRLTQSLADGQMILNQAKVFGLSDPTFDAIRSGLVKAVNYQAPYEAAVLVLQSYFLKTRWCVLKRVPAKIIKFTRPDTPKPAGPFNVSWVQHSDLIAQEQKDKFRYQPLRLVKPITELSDSTLVQSVLQLHRYIEGIFTGRKNRSARVEHVVRDANTCSELSNEIFLQVMRMMVENPHPAQVDSGKQLVLNLLEKTCPPENVRLHLKAFFVDFPEHLEAIEKSSQARDAPKSLQEELEMLEDLAFLTAEQKPQTSNPFQAFTALFGY